jgi:transcriptional regulator with XRE-family HTH domain
MNGATENRLAELMAANRVSRQELAVQLGITEDRIRQLEKPETLIPSRYIQTLTIKFNVSADHLLGLDRESSATKAAA